MPKVLRKNQKLLKLIDKSYNDFLAEVEVLRKEFWQKIKKILEEIDKRKLKEIEEKIKKFKTI